MLFDIERLVNVGTYLSVVVFVGITSSAIVSLFYYLRNMTFEKFEKTRKFEEEFPLIGLIISGVAFLIFIIITIILTYSCS
jgi:hypothetical protein